MRFLFVYQDFSAQARELLDELRISDVKLIVARKGAERPTTEEFEFLKAHQGAEAAACQIDRKYRRSVELLVSFSCEPKKFRFQDQQLREWLVPKNIVAVTYERPSTAFLLAAANAPLLVIHPNALTFADELSELRWRFATLASKVLERYANGEPLQSLREWKAVHGVEFAANGRVSYKFEIVGGSGPQVTFWHLKEGDNTTRENAARIYFCRTEFAAKIFVVVFYVGPHPDDGEYRLDLRLGS